MNDATSTCSERELVYGFAVGALSAAEARTFVAHLASCAKCGSELDTLRSVMASFVSWPSDVLRPSTSLWDRLAERIAGDGQRPALDAPRTPPARRLEWNEVAPGISCKVLATDLATDRVSMLVRLAPGVDYPAHRHADGEELHLLHGELLIDARTLHPGDYYSAEAGTMDTRVWSATGCTCVLMTSLNDELVDLAVRQ
jgi:anti-sigma factor ChrR (cupin superfamily)